MIGRPAQIAVLVAALVGAVLVPSAARAAPGDLVSAKAFRPVIDGKPALAGVRAWKVTFRSTTTLGRALTESGTVLVPRARWTKPGPRPLVSYAPGTVGLADRCAVSSQLDGGRGFGVGGMEALLERGWALAVPDYPGLGTPGEHPYAIGPALGPAVLDIARAARKLRDAGLDPRGPLGITGYSEGGIAAGWALELQPRYAPELHVTSAAIGGVLADPLAVIAHLDGGPYAFLVIYAAVAMDAAYPGIGLVDALDPAGRAYAAKLAAGCLPDALKTIRPFGIAEYAHGVDLNHRPDVVAHDRQNTMGRTAPKPPTLLMHATTDEILPYEQAAALVRTWCRKGANVRMKPLVGKLHTAGGDAFVDPSVRWLANGFAGKAPARRASCGG